MMPEERTFGNLGKLMMTSSSLYTCLGRLLLLIMSVCCANSEGCPSRRDVVAPMPVHLHSCHYEYPMNLGIY